ncbi:Arm DNA-binding domain-containing protein [Algibacter sp. L1A34]|uniref:Arm DNA-binding domain-containing protein n=1 Tax=Algibacter sp. L1A34 TaxID=2686365 RepID=UPI00293BC104|nr:Arm DNA-binding domain-containing protein [Algibacter sp. L1A34]
MQTNKTFSIVLFTRKSRSIVSKLSIYARITVNGKRSEISLKRTVLTKSWDASKSRGRGSSYSSRVLNSYLNQEYNRLLDCHKQLLEEDKVISSKTIKSRYLGDDNTRKTLNDLLYYHNTNMVSVLKQGTMKNYYTTE